MTHPLHATAISKRYGNHTVLDGIDLRVEPGETVLLLGPNGVGKSTLLGCVCGTVIPDAGTVSIGGHDLGSAPLKARAALRFLPQEVEVPAGLTGEELLAHQAVVGEVEAVLQHPHGRGRFAVDLLRPAQGLVFEVGVVDVLAQHRRFAVDGEHEYGELEEHRVGALGDLEILEQEVDDRTRFAHQ